MVYIGVQVIAQADPVGTLITSSDGSSVVTPETRAAGAPAPDEAHGFLIAHAKPLVPQRIGDAAPGLAAAAPPQEALLEVLAVLAAQGASVTA